MLESIRYSEDSRIRLHISLAGTSVCEDDITERYGYIPEAKEPLGVVHLDPGGFAFADTEPIEFIVKGITFSVKPEHLYAASDCSFRALGEDWVKVYLGYTCLVLPEQLWAEVQSILTPLNLSCPDGRDLLADRISDIPNVRMKP
jgi:hypothetical protein